jgi:hypothetical protein
MSDDLELLHKQLAEAREKAAAAAEKRAKRFELDDLKREIEHEIREAAEQEALEELEVQHGRHGLGLWRIPTEVGMVVVRKPTPAKYRGFVDRGKGDQNTVEQFVREFVVYPDKAAFNQIVLDQPGTIKRCLDAIVHLAGIRAKEELPGKLTAS